MKVLLLKLHHLGTGNNYFYHLGVGNNNFYHLGVGNNSHLPMGNNLDEVHEVTARPL